MKRTYKGQYFDVDSQGNQFSVAFKMVLEIDEKMNFIGTVWEEEFSAITGLESSVKGYIENDHISFLLSYPCFYGENDEGEIIIDKSIAGHDVIYDAYWDENNGNWVGEWEVEGSKVSSSLDQIKTEVYIGQFEMKACDS